MTNLIALDCPKCGASLGPALATGDHLCAHCGERSRPKVEVVHVAVPQEPTFHVIPTAAELAARNAEFQRNSQRDQAAREARAKVHADGERQSRTIIRVLVALFVGLPLLGGIVAAILYFVLR